jgi:hypothetical protein
LHRRQVRQYTDRAQQTEEDHNQSNAERRSRNFIANTTILVTDLRAA